MDASIFQMPLMLFLILSSITYTVANTGDVQLVRGVELKQQPFYPPHKDFTCLDGSKSIPFSAVNDDYCDCADGTDEPGTSACPEGRYYCYNIGYKASYIPSSRVNDGICDCCDGSDEYDSDVVCFNECEKLGEEEKELRKEEMAESLEGAKVRSDYIQSGKERKEIKLQRIETINNLLEQRRKELEAATALKDEAEKPEKEAKDKHEKEFQEQQAKRKAEQDSVERNAAFDILDVDKDGWVSVAELVSHNHMESDMTEEEAKTMLGGNTMVDIEGIVDVWKNVKPKFRTEGRPDPSQFDESNNEPLPEPEEEKKEEDKEKSPDTTGELKNGGDLPPPPHSPPPRASTPPPPSSLTDDERVNKLYGEGDEEEDEYKNVENAPEEEDEDEDKDDDDEKDDEDVVRVPE